MPIQETTVENAKKDAPSLKLKLSLKKETLRTLEATEVDGLEDVVGGTCACTAVAARTYVTFTCPE